MLKTLEKVRKDFKKPVSLADLIVLGGWAAVEQAAKNAGRNVQVSTRKRDVKDGKAEDATRQPEQIRAFRDTWKLGIHSYLAHLRDRLTAARELLTESGSVFVQIGDENVHHVEYAFADCAY